MGKRVITANTLQLDNERSLSSCRVLAVITRFPMRNSPLSYRFTLSITGAKVASAASSF
jgi:hypothetical protein